MSDVIKKYGAGVDFAPAFAEMKPLWADASPKEVGTNDEPRTPPAGARQDLPSYRIVTDDRPWRPVAR